MRDGNSSRPLVIRAAGGAEVGGGHIMRCIALSEAWQAREGSVHFILSPSASRFEQRLRSGGADVHFVPNERAEEIEAVAEHALETGASWLVLDGYMFDGAYQSALKSRVKHLLVVDDNRDHESYAADIIVNPNVYAAPALYERCGRRMFAFGHEIHAAAR